MLSEDENLDFNSLTNLNRYKVDVGTYVIKHGVYIDGGPEIDISWNGIPGNNGEVIMGVMEPFTEPVSFYLYTLNTVTGRYDPTPALGGGTIIFDASCPTPTTTTTTTTTTAAPLIDNTTTTTTTIPPCGLDLSSLKVKYLAHNDILEDTVWKESSIKDFPTATCNGYFSCGDIRVTRTTPNLWTARQEINIISDLYMRVTYNVEDCLSNAVDFAQLVQFYSKNDAGEITQSYVSELVSIDTVPELVTRVHGHFAKGETLYYWVIESYLDG